MSELFPYLPQRPGCHKRLKAALPLLKRMTRELAMAAAIWHNNLTGAAVTRSLIASELLV
ncbi:hypothetical protein Spla01_02992 [Streptomyces platensis]|uniref:Uncharacterized protein n=1 Tax=Streptomyces platensis TaxID=58346 RepID=A0ABX3XMQ8_STRPT|nr:hypothetical protein [Streptomyces platensis]OSY35936.1 hypothetical protein BG653_07009 [Streptomyces platensis]